MDPLAPEGIPYFALNAPKDFEIEGGEFGDARGSANAMDGWTAGVFAQGRALIDWNVRNRVSWFKLCVGRELMSVLPRLWEPDV